MAKVAMPYLFFKGTVLVFARIAEVIVVSVALEMLEAGSELELVIERANSAI